KDYSTTRPLAAERRTCFLYLQGVALPEAVALHRDPAEFLAQQHSPTLASHRRAATGGAYHCRDLILVRLVDLAQCRSLVLLTRGPPAGRTQALPYARRGFMLVFYEDVRALHKALDVVGRFIEQRAASRIVRPLQPRQAVCARRLCHLVVDLCL